METALIKRKTFVKREPCMINVPIHTKQNDYWEGKRLEFIQGDIVYILNSTPDAIGNYLVYSKEGKVGYCNEMFLESVSDLIKEDIEKGPKDTVIDTGYLFKV